MHMPSSGHESKMGTEASLTYVEPMAGSFSVPVDTCSVTNNIINVEQHALSQVGNRDGQLIGLNFHNFKTVPEATLFSPIRRQLTNLSMENIISNNSMETILMQCSEGGISQDAACGGRCRSLSISPQCMHQDISQQSKTTTDVLQSPQIDTAKAGWSPVAVLPHSPNFNILESDKRLSYDMHQRKADLLAGADESWPSLGVSMVKGLGSLGGSHDASCMEQLLVHCATALENSDVSWAQQIMWVLNNIASAEGGPNQRVTACFLRALLSRATRMVPSLAPSLYGEGCQKKALTAVELAEFVDLTPWHRFGFSAANGAIMKAVERKARVHIIDFSITHCMQWPTLIEELSKRPEGAPYIRLSVHAPATRQQIPPFLNLSYEEVGLKLANFARTKNLPFAFRVIHDEAEQLSPVLFDLREEEALAVNCHMSLHYVPEETADLSCPRDEMLRMIHSLYPTILTFVDEDANLTSTSLATRLKSAFNYLWIPFDTVDTFLPKSSKQRLLYEADIGNKIENIIACEGRQRVERLESKDRWIYRLKGAGYQILPFSEDVISEVRSMLDHHAAGWGLKKEEDVLLLTWKGHNAVFATAWVPLP